MLLAVLLQGWSGAWHTAGKVAALALGNLLAGWAADWVLWHL